jgi:nucleoside diphosphate kinase
MAIRQLTGSVKTRGNSAAMIIFLTIEGLKIVASVVLFFTEEQLHHYFHEHKLTAEVYFYAIWLVFDVTQVTVLFCIHHQNFKKYD